VTVARPGYHPRVRGADVEKPSETPPEAPGLPALALALFFVACCTTIVLTGGGPDRAPYMLRWSVVLSDIFLGLVVVTQLPELPALWRDWRRHRCALAAVGRRSRSTLRGEAASPSSVGSASR
jgi:hypothetical protein